MTLGEFLPNSNTKLLLHFNGNSNDSSGNGNNCTDNAITYSQANGKFGQGAGFVSANSSFMTKSSPSNLPAGATSRTMAFWIKNTKAGDAYFAWYGTLSVGQGFGVGNINEETGRRTYFVRYGSDIDFGEATEDGLWHVIIVTYDGTTVKCYKDLILKASATSALNTGSTVLAIGGQDASTYLLDGGMEEFIIESGVWSFERMQKYVTMTKGRFGII